MIRWNSKIIMNHVKPKILSYTNSLKILYPYPLLIIYIITSQTYNHVYIRTYTHFLSKSVTNNLDKT